MKLINDDCLKGLKSLDIESINCVVTSPPYWGLRDYGTAIWEGGDENCNHKTGFSSPKSTLGGGKSTQNEAGGFYKDKCGKCGAKRIDLQLGLESTFPEYINKLCNIFDEVKRVLRKDGTCWVNLGDVYSGSTQTGGTNSLSGKGKTQPHVKFNRNQYPDPKNKASLRAREQVEYFGLPNKCLCQIPSRFAIEMCNRGWILRNTIIWHKPNCMPSSVKDRFTVDFEYIFFFVKNKKYWFETQYEPVVRPELVNKTRNVHAKKWDKGGLENMDYERRKNVPYCSPLGRNKRCVWKITTKPFKDAHFAVFPEALVETPIKAGCPEFVCNKCGKAREKIYKTTVLNKGTWTGKGHQYRDKLNAMPKCPDGYKSKKEMIGYTNCSCNDGFSGGIVLDPFMGSGTVGVVAEKLGMQFIGIELNPDYVKMAEKRINNEKGLF